MKRLNYRMFSAIAAALFLTSSAAFAQDDFDLNSQRLEKQDVMIIPGQKIDHKGLIINPTPQSLKLIEGEGLNYKGGFASKDKKGKFSEDIAFLNHAYVSDHRFPTIKLSIDFAAKKSDIKQLSGAYKLTINKKGISILGFDERGAFYGLQTLRQILDSPVASDGKLPFIEINDYPLLPNRGVVEGFYGTPWSHEVRTSLIDFYGRFKMNAYIYGPKDDPYHSCPNWRLPYPEEEAENIKSLVAACRKNRVDFVWAIHPGQDIKWNDEDYQNLVQKFNWMYDLGVRDFAIFFDDINGDGTDPYKQTALLNRLSDDFVKSKGDVSPLIICPTDYSKLWAGPGENQASAIYGRTLQEGIKVFWTGDYVCSDLTKETMDWINSRIKRPAYYWWNFPVTDYARHIIMQGPTYGLETGLTAEDVSGIVSNPMEHGEASKLALYGVADYAWNPREYNPIDNWERGIELLMPKAAQAYRTFAIHSCDTENGYRRDESWETRSFRLANWDDKKADDLLAEFERVGKAYSEIKENCDNKLLVTELEPWLIEFEKLGKRGEQAIRLMQEFRKGGCPEAFWNSYVGNLMCASDKEAYNAHKSGTMKLQPFYEYAMDDMAYEFLKTLIGEDPQDYVGIGSFQTASTTQTKLMLDKNDETYYTSGISQKEGDWLGLDLRAVRDLKNIHILQGRNSVDDVDYFDHALLECSVDGKNWTVLIDDMKKQYVIDWPVAEPVEAPSISAGPSTPSTSSGTAGTAAVDPVKARYVRLRRLESEKKNYCAIREFSVNPVCGPAPAAYDKNLGTSFVMDGSLELAVSCCDDGKSPAAGVDKKECCGEEKLFRILSGKLEQPLVWELYTAAGELVGSGESGKAFTEISAPSGIAKLVLKGKAEIFEIITE